MSSPPIDSRNEEIIGGLVGEGDLTTDEHNIITIEDGIIRREVRRVTRFYPGCLHATTIGIGGRCSVCDSIVCRLCLNFCGRCRRSLCNFCQRMKNGKVYCDNCHLFVIFFGDRANRPRENQTHSISQNQSNLRNTRTRNRSADWFRFFFGE